MRLLTARQLAKEYPGIGERTIRAWSDLPRGNLPYVQMGRGRYYDVDEFVRWVTNNRTVRR